VADQLLSQADVDALVLSLTRSELATESTATKPKSAESGSTRGINTLANKTPTPGKVTDPIPIKTTNNPTKTTQILNSSHSVSSTQVASLKATIANRQEQKNEMRNDYLNALDVKVAGLSQQLQEINSTLKRLNTLEKKIINLEKVLENNRQNPDLSPRIAQLNEEFQKIGINLRGTPGYGIRHNFTCEKCHDHGHVAEMFRCTKCGHERWYGWWPDKK
jgi:hypothetical protein